MASVRKRLSKDGTPLWQVRFVMDGRESAQSFSEKNGPGAEDEARRFCDLVNSLRDPRRALELWGLALPETTMEGITVSQWLAKYLRTKTGLRKKTLVNYRGYIDRDINPRLGDIPLSRLSHADIAGWVNSMTTSGKTIEMKHAFLSGALKHAIRDGHLTRNPCEGMKMPRSHRKEMTFLTHEQYRILRSCFSDHYKPFVEFLVASGARFSEVTALRPNDVDRNGTVRINKAWNLDPETNTWELGTPKTVRSVRTIDVDPWVLDHLDYSREWLFVNTAGNPVRIYGWRQNVWYRATAKAQLDPRPRIHDLRHTCASWMIAAKVPLPVIQRHLGHESIQTTIGVYGHLDRDLSKSAATAISVALRTD